MDRFINNYGLNHIAKNIFSKSDTTTIKNCLLVDKSWNAFIDKQDFWYHRIKQSKSYEHIEEWEKIFSTKRNEEENKSLTRVLKSSALNGMIIKRDIRMRLSRDIVKSTCPIYLSVLLEETVFLLKSISILE